MSINWISLQPKFSCILVAHFIFGRKVEFVILSEQIPLACASSAIDALCDAQKMCAVIKVGTVLKSTFLHSESYFNPPSQIKRAFAAHEDV